jgi:NAD(P)H-flavin reductase
MNQLILVQNEYAGAELRLLTFDRTLEGFTKPGQFVTAHPDDLDKAFFALASCPGQPIQLLVKQGGDTANHLCGLQVDATLAVSDVIGKGFNIPSNIPGPLFVIATGSGISAVRSVIQAEVDQGLTRPLTLIYGVRTVEHCAMTECLATWKEAGVNVHIVLSQGPEAWSGPRGHVQDVVTSLDVIAPDATVVLCGQSGMVKDIQARFTEAGIDAPRILTNF